MEISHRVTQRDCLRQTGRIRRNAHKGAHIEVEGSLSRERTIETNDGSLTIRPFSVKAESIRKLDRVESANKQKSVDTD